MVVEVCFFCFPPIVVSQVMTQDSMRNLYQQIVACRPEGNAVAVNKCAACKLKLNLNVLKGLKSADLGDSSRLCTCLEWSEIPSCLFFKEKGTLLPPTTTTIKVGGGGFMLPL